MDPALVRTAYMTIGNSDNRLTQGQWSQYCAAAHALVHFHHVDVFFVGYSAPFSQYQNACFSFTYRAAVEDELRKEIAELAFRFNQNNIALALIDAAELVEP